MSLPSQVGLPAEMQYNLDYSIPPDAKSYALKVQASNVSSVTSSFTPANTATTYFGDQVASSQNIIFDIPVGSSPSLFCNNMFSTLSFNATFSFPSAGTINTGSFYDAYIRSGGYSFFDRMYITSQNGQIIEDITEFAMVCDTLVALQMNKAVRNATANQYGFDVNSQQLGSQGRKINILSAANVGPSTSQTETMSFSIPLVSGVLGVLADRMLNIGRTSKLQIVFQTAPILPITGGINAVWTATPTIQVALSNFSLQLEYVDIGINALQMVDAGLTDGKCYVHGTTYRTSSATLPASTNGATSILAGIRASSVKSLFTRFAQGGTANATNGLHGKFNSFNPLLNSINYSIGGLRFPQNSINPLLAPAQAKRETELAIGSWNNSTFNSSIPPSQYCRLSAGGTAQSLTVGSTQEWFWNSGGDVVNSLSQFIFGENLEIIAKRGLLSGLNCTSAPIFVEMNISASLTNAHNMYVIALLDHVIIHDVKSGDIQVRI
jgi:hypothetical protein